MATDGMLAKGLHLLVALGGHPDGVGVTMLSREVGIPVSTVHRLLATMVDLGFVHFDDATRHYRLGLKVFELSSRASWARTLSEVALPVMRRVAEVTTEAVSLSVRDGAELVYVGWAEGRNRIQVEGTVGTRGPLHCTSQGKTFLAFLGKEEQQEVLGQLRLEPKTPKSITSPAKLREELEWIRGRGYAIADEENEEGVRAIAVPVMNTDERPIATICVVAPAFRTSVEDLEGFVPLLQDASREISLQLSQTQTLP